MPNQSSKLFCTSPTNGYIFTSAPYPLTDCIVLTFIDVKGNLVYMYSWVANHLKFLNINWELAKEDVLLRNINSTQYIKSYSLADYVDKNGTKSSICSFCGEKLTCLANNKTAMAVTTATRFNCANPTRDFDTRAKTAAWLKQAIKTLNKAGFVKNQALLVNKGSSIVWWYGWNQINVTPKRVRFSTLCLTCVLYKCKGKKSPACYPVNTPLTIKDFTGAIFDRDKFVHYYTKERTNAFLTGKGEVYKFKNFTYKGKYKYKNNSKTPEYSYNTALALNNYINDFLSPTYGYLGLKSVLYIPKYEVIRFKFKGSSDYTFLGVGHGALRIRLVPGKNSKIYNV